MARPKKGAEKRLTCDFRVRVTAELRKALDERVAAENSTITGVVTSILEQELLRTRHATANDYGK